ncbi:MAG: NAD(P)/FAD-dependent oxidoreductase [Chloroflexi bacterium]|nr:NAD(P)/FAD-dependent oxidoreductase [Chloroflexota bacterium]
MTRPRVAVVGAGPAGSTAARLLAERGAEVRLFEARPLPRPKTCGGGLTPKAQRLVPTLALKAVERRVERVELRGPHGSPFRLVAPAAGIAMVERERFDLALVEAAVRAGADVEDDNPVRELREDGSGVDLRTHEGHWRADVVVAADGEPSRAARQLGLGGPARRRALALEVDLPLANGLPNDTAILDFAIPGGYGWYFPKGDHANVGVGSHDPPRYLRLRDDLARLTDELGLHLGATRVQGHWIPQGLRIGRLASERVILAGDAAATADPLFGEGISYAILSGIAAAQTIDAWEDGSIRGLRSYDGRLRAVLGPPLERLDMLARAAEVSINGALFLARLSGRVRERAVDAIAGRRAPFVIDGQCELACACSLHELEPPPMALVSSKQEPGRFRHCEQCTARCAA